MGLLDLVRRRPALPPPGAHLRPDDPFGLAQAVWGLGFSSPGNPAFAVGLVDGCDLRPTSLVLDLTAGLGGRARTLATVFGCYVTGLERDLARAKRGMRLSEEAGLVREAPVQPYSPAGLELRPASFDVIVEDNLLAELVEKEQLLRKLGQGLRRGGWLVLAEPVGADGEIELWSEAQYADCLRGLGFAPEKPRDLSAEYRRIIETAWRGFLDRTDIRFLAAAHRDEVMRQLQFWTERASRLEAGGLRFVRIAARAAAKPKRGRLDLRRGGSYVPPLSRDRKTPGPRS